MKWIILAAAAAALSTAIPIDETTQDLVERDTTTARLAKFDDLSNGDYPTNYKGLNFSAVTVSSYNDRVKTQSPPNSIQASSGGSPYFNIVGTKTKSFDIDSFYIGFFDGRGGSILPLNFTITGLNAQGGGHQGPILLTYKPVYDTTFTALEQKFTVGWSGLKAFYVDVVTDPATLVRTVTSIDDVKYTTHQ